MTDSHDDAWTITAEGEAGEMGLAARFAVGNGFFGIKAGGTLRGPGEAPGAARAYLAGLFDTPRGPGLLPGQDVPALVPMHWPRLTIRRAGAPLAFPRRRLTLDMKRGLLDEDYGAAGGLRCRTRHLASAETPHLALQLVWLEAEEAQEITLEAAFDGMEGDLVPEGQDETLAAWRTGCGTRRIVIATEAELSVEGEALTAHRPEPFHHAWRWRARRGEVAVFARFIVAIREELDGADPRPAARAALAAARRQGWQGALAAHEAAMARRWETADLRLEGDPAAQQALRFAIHHLLACANPADPRVSIGARALSGEDYRGHVFWDTEIYLLPFYSYVWPEAARALLLYRHRTLDGARAKARAMGWRGALYAWESAETGAETTPERVIGPEGKPVEVLCGRLEQHISADIAHAVWQHWQISGDADFLREAGAEILLETARFWASRASLEADGRRHIRNVIGPDEYHEGVDDNAYTNLMARWTIERGLETAALMRARFPRDWAALSARLALGEAEMAQWSAAADGLVTGFDPGRGLFEQFAGYFAREDIALADLPDRSRPVDVVLGRERVQGSQLIKQADVVALLALQPELVDDATAAANFAYYDARTGHGSSLSRVFHGLVAARLGRIETAEAHFRAASGIDLGPAVSASAGGVHIATQGGLWQLAVLGFLGLRHEAEGLSLSPRLPPTWSEMTLRLHWQGRRLRVQISQGGAVRAWLEAGEAMSLRVLGTAHRLAPGAVLALG